jgi:hypothetical protein
MIAFFDRHAVVVMATVCIILVEVTQDSNPWVSIGITLLTVVAMRAYVFFRIKEKDGR